MRTVSQALPVLRRHESALNATRNTVNLLRATWRGRSAADRALPHFVILGTQRGGTTSLHEDLSKHNRVSRPLAKEVQYFTVNYARGERWYRAHFPRQQAGQLTFEASPYYLFHPAVPARAAALLPQTKFIVLLRNPASRAYSHYLHNRTLGVEDLPFEKAIDAEEVRLKEAERLGIDSPEGQRLHRNFSYMSRGMYAQQLSHWLTYVPASRIKVLKSEEWFGDPSQTYAEVLDFLDLPHFVPQTWAAANVLGSRASQMSPQIEERLKEHFAADGQELRRLLGWNTAWD